MQFQVPQFIEVEDKVVGPLSFKQFLYLAGGAGLSFVLWIFLPTFIAFLVIIPVVALSLALAFYKVNNKPFSFILESAIRYFLGGKLYIWKKEPKKVTPKKQVSGVGGGETSVYVPRLSESKLRDLAWSLDVKDYGRTNEQPTTDNEQR
ncbi:PrgI family protein [bacterium]|nr:PrgI family protein [bacterium]